MRILFHHRTLGDGAEGVHITSMVRAFRALGHEVDVAELARQDRSTASPGLIARVRHGLPALAVELAAIGFNAADYLQVRSAIRRRRPDFLYARHGRFALGALAAARRAGVPIVLEVNALFTSAGYAQFEPLSLPGLATAMERRALRLGTIVTAVSTPLARQIASLSGVAPLVVPNGADPASFDPARHDRAAVRGRLGLGDDFVIGWVGILRSWHGLDLVLRALAALPASTVLLVVGDGPERGALETEAERLGVANRLRITGRVRHDQVGDLLSAMDVAVVAADRTGVASPMKLLEYMSMALPVVAPQADNVRDLVSDGEDGFLFPAGDAVAIAGVLQRLIDDRELGRAAGKRARLKVERERNWTSIAARVIAEISAHVPR